MTDLKRSRPTIGILPGYSTLSGNTPDHYRSTVLQGIYAAAGLSECNLLLGWSLRQEIDQAVVHPAWPVSSPDSNFVPVGPWNSDGMIVFTPLQNDAHSRYLQGLRAKGYPLLFIATGEDAPTISTGNEAGIRQAVEHMATFHGHQHIAFLAGHPEDQGDSAARLQAFQAAVIDYGLDTDPRLVNAGLHTVPGGYRALQALLNSGVKFTALIASNDASAIGALRALRETDLQVPRDIALIGFDDQPDALAQVPPLASIHVPLLEIGEQALTLMADHLNGLQNLHSIQIPTWLIPRQSCGCIPQAMRSAFENKTDVQPSQSRASVRDISAVQEKIAAGMSATLPASFRQAFAAQAGRFCSSLVEGFYTSLKAGSALDFHERLIDFLQELELITEDIDPWQSAISALRQEMTQLPAAWRQARIRRLAEDMLHQARCAISESAQRQVYRHHYHQQIADQTLGEVTSRLSAILDERQAVEILEANLADIGIKHVRVALFEPDEEDPVAWSIILNPHSELADQRFPTRSFPPPGLYPADELLNLFILPLIFQNEPLGYIAFDASNLEPCTTIARQLASTIKTARLHKQVIELSLKDPLSGIYNRRYFDLFLNNEVNRSIRLGHELAIIMLDIDHFKKYNDTFGHPAGDKVIQNLAICMKEERRSTDVAARIGGEEFALILPGTDLEGARFVAEKIQQVIRTSPGFEHPITVSMGISVLSGAGIEAEALVKEADLALYEAKQTGRDRICIFERVAKRK